MNSPAQRRMQKRRLREAEAAQEANLKKKLKPNEPGSTVNNAR